MLNVASKRCRAVSRPGRFQHIDVFRVRKSTVPERFYKCLPLAQSGWSCLSCTLVGRELVAELSIWWSNGSVSKKWGILLAMQNLAVKAHPTKFAN